MERLSTLIGRLLVTSVVVVVVATFSPLPLLLFTTWFHWWTVVLGLLLYALEAVGLYATYRYVARHRQTVLPKLTAKVSWKTVLITAIGTLSILLLAVGNQWLDGVLHLPVADNQRLLNGLMAAHPLSVGIGLCVFGPICEELLFRGLFTSNVVDGRDRQRGFALITLIVSSLLFGLAHTDFTVSLQLPYYVAFGVACGAVYWSTGRDIRANAAVHMLANLIMLLI